MAETESEPPQEITGTQDIQDFDRDSAHTLALSILNLKTMALDRARMIKNSRLEGVVEIFQSASTGSGQIDVDFLPNEFDWPTMPPHPDLILLRKISALSSYDVYSLRLLLRDLGVPIKDLTGLSLSEAKKKELTEYMKEFTRPLISQIYGDEDKSLTDLDSVLSLFRDPDVEKAREKLQVMADQLKIEIQEIPKFLEDYGDIYLSLSYFEKGLKDYEASIDIFIKSVEELQEHDQLKSDPKFMKACHTITTTINYLLNTNKERFKYLEKYTKDMWNDLSADKFRNVEKTIKSYHTTIGGALCTLSVKMDAWNIKFPSSKAGGPIKRSDFIMSDMIHGIDKILEMERKAPPLPKGEIQADQEPADQPPGDKAEGND